MTPRYSYKDNTIKGRSALQLIIDEELVSQKEHEVFMTFEKVWDLAADPYKTFTITTLINNLNVRVIFDDKLNVEWSDMGIKGHFKDIFENQLTEGRIDKQYQGLIFQDQGFRLSIRRKP